MSTPIRFDIAAHDRRSRARAGVLTTPHGVVHTPALCPVATQATVKSLAPDELRDLGAELVLVNAYHLNLRPGADLVAKLGGLHSFMAWDGPLMTDSGGWQVFSLGFALEHGVGKIAGLFPDEGDTRVRARGQRPRLTRVDADGVTFTSHIDGSRHRFSPEISIGVQERLGADLILAFDECTSPLHDEGYTAEALTRTHRWAQRCLDARTRSDQALLGIVQGGAFEELRRESAAFIGGLPFDGFAVGGSLGRSKEDMRRVLDWTVPLFAEDRPRHLLGIGEPEDIFDAVERGIDTFDCVSPTRLARHGMLYTPDGRIAIRNAQFQQDFRPVDSDCLCYTCRHFSRAYLRHLFVAEELLGYRLATIHNLAFMLGLLERIRDSIRQGELAEMRRGFAARWGRAEVTIGGQTRDAP
ncbi:MAG: tRNA guanosine(34) transglycosylase Tgt [Chloroflexi bacterium]|nr:tRNA guanosine(34) transglycosylase Tgt [Chloroflexota bacterium]